MRLLVDGDACPVKDEVYAVAHRCGVPVTLVANKRLFVPTRPPVELVVVGAELDAADDWIAEHARPGDVVITADIPLAARCLAAGAHVLGTDGRPFTDDSIGGALATRELKTQLRDVGVASGGPRALSTKDRSRFLSKLDELVQKSRALKRHPRHDEVARTVASWYQTAHADQGYEVELRRFGWYRTNRYAPEWGAVSAVDVDDVSAFLRDVDGFFGDRSVALQFARKPAATEELVAAGWIQEEETVYLTHVGDFPATAEVEIEIVEPTAPESLARVKLQSFGDFEAEPDAAALELETTARGADLRGDGRGLIARADGRPAAMCAYYSGVDFFVFLLGTRVPFRGRGIASAILHRVVDTAREAGARSVVINARAGSAPEALYRRLGFADEVHRQWTFRRRAP